MKNHFPPLAVFGLSFIACIGQARTHVPHETHFVSSQTTRVSNSVSAITGQEAAQAPQ
jgi:hypothetical protein